jgi:hypothetical protein
LPAKALNTTTNKGAGKILVGSNDPITELFVPPIEDDAAKTTAVVRQKQKSISIAQNRCGPHAHVFVSAVQNMSQIANTEPDPHDASHLQNLINQSEHLPSPQRTP